MVDERYVLSDLTVCIPSPSQHSKTEIASFLISPMHSPFFNICVIGHKVQTGLIALGMNGKHQEGL